VNTDQNVLLDHEEESCLHSSETFSTDEDEEERDNYLIASLEDWAFERYLEYQS
jgi:hypothetical protein